LRYSTIVNSHIKDYYLLDDHAFNIKYLLTCGNG